MATHAAVARPQEQGGGTRLLSGDIVLDIESPAAAAVSARFRLGGEGAVIVLLADLPGQQIEHIEMRIDGRDVTFDQERRSSALRAVRPAAEPGAEVAAESRPEAGAGVAAEPGPEAAAQAGSRPGTAVGAELLEISYRVRNAASALYRFALPVPEATPTGAERSVGLTVRLPGDARFAGNSFPPLLAEAGAEWRAATLAVPALAHVVFGDATPRLWAHQILEWTALVVATAMLLAGWYWSRRRAGDLGGAAR